MPEQSANITDPLAGLSGQALARARRAMLSQIGKKALSMSKAPSTTASAQDKRVDSAPAKAMPTEPVREMESEPERIAEASPGTVIEPPPAEAACTEANGMSSSDYCRMRRQALATQGKKALPAMQGGSASGQTQSSAGQSYARKRRAEQSLKGRGNAPVSRPSGRMRPQPSEAPAKVETGTTLSGGAVTGTQVERTARVTGNEPGSCRAITGTEYIGAEQFDAFCGSRPSPAPAKVGMSATSRGQWVSGTEVGRTPQVTGGESGTCKPVTGTEYLGSETFADFCAGKGVTSGREKVSVGATALKGLSVTGSDEARSNAVTGTEAGAKRGITGSQYNDAGVSRLTINGPAKVALTHTVAGRPVSGTEVGRSNKVTGDEAGACRTVSGTEYLSNEQFKSVCQTRPEPGPEKVGEATSEAGQRITGNLVERTGKVTGNEPRAEGRVTGSQYEHAGIPGEAPAKVRELRTLAGRALTGGVMSGASSPKLTGDEQGGRQRVTGIEYAGLARTDASVSAPESLASAAKVDITHTQRGQTVSGSPMGRSSRVTGDEPGSNLAISGTPYAASEQIAGACACQHRAEAEPAQSSRFHPRFQPQGRPRAMAMSMLPAEPRPESFSVSAPTQEARGRITGTGYGGSGRITGPVNMASGLVSGTPEFRYREEDAFTGGSYPRFSRPAVNEAAAPTSQGERITGEGREAGRHITGDDWGRSDRVTGTEGRWAQGRNPTLRGAGRGMASGAWANKELERPEVPIAKVTGSSGNAGKGAMITVSGGARG